jgi:hypothetical protein
MTTRKRQNGQVAKPTDNQLCPKDGYEWASDTKETKQLWLWPGAVPRGCLVLIEGRKCTGKSSVAAAVAAGLTGGPRLKNWCGPRQAPVLWVASEDAWTSIVVPRLVAAEADLAHVARLSPIEKDGVKRKLVLPGDLPHLEAVLRSTGAQLLVLDPYISLCHPSLDCRIEQQARAYLEPLAELLDQLGVTGLLTRHVRKGAGGDTREAGLGSVAVGNVARSILRCDEHPYEPGKRVLTVVACNYGKRMVSQLYEIVSADNGEPRVKWLGDCALDADDVAEGRGSAAERDEWSDADTLIYSLVGEGSASVDSIRNEAEPAMISLRMLRRSKERLGVRSKRVPTATGWAWEWTAPEGGWPSALVKNAKGGGVHTRKGGALPQRAPKTVKKRREFKKAPKAPPIHVHPPKAPPQTEDFSDGNGEPSSTTFCGDQTGGESPDCSQ